MPKQKYLKAKGVVAAITIVLVLAAYVLFTYQYYTAGVKMNDLFFIVTGGTIGIFSGLLFSFFKNTIVRALLLFGGVFYTILIFLFLYSLMTVNEGYIYSKVALFIGLGIGIIYLLYDVFTNHFKNRSYTGP